VTFLFDHDVPDDLSHLLSHLGHRVTFLREVLPRDSPDAAVLDYAVEHRLILVTCNRDDFAALGAERSHPGIVIVTRRRSRAQERAALLRLLERATEAGLANNVWPRTECQAAIEQHNRLVVGIESGHDPADI
jgi:predicted nuclease of predicted toxin-antitoxin system